MSLSLRPRDLVGPVTRVKRKKKKLKMDDLGIVAERHAVQMHGLPPPLLALCQNILHLRSHMKRFRLINLIANIKNSSWLRALSFECGVSVYRGGFRVSVCVSGVVPWSSCQCPASQRCTAPQTSLPPPCSAVQGSGFRVQGSGFRVQGSDFRFQGPGFRV